MPVYESIKNADNKIKISAANRDSVVFGWENAVSFLADKVKAGAKAIACDSIAQGIARAKELAGKDGVVLCFGSLYSIGDIQKAYLN